MKDSTFKKYCLIIDEMCVNGYNQRQSYRKMYPNASVETADVEMVRILSIPKVADYLKTKQENKANELNITLLDQLSILNDIKLSTEEKASDRINAVKEQNKLLALYEEHNRQKKSDLVSDKVVIQFKNKK